MMKNILSKPVLVERVILLHWFLFFLTNGLDKFLTGRDLLLFRWFGKDRTEQFGNYFGRADLPHEWITPAIYGAGAWEVALALLFLAAGFNGLRHDGEQPGNSAALSGLLLAVLTFTGFSVFDVIAGDRAELLEHNIYLGLVVLSWFVITYRRDRAAERPRAGMEAEAPASLPSYEPAPHPAGAGSMRSNGQSGGGSGGRVRPRVHDDGVEEPYLDLARKVALRHPYVSTGLISRRFEIGESQAEGIMAVLEEEGLVIPRSRSIPSRSRHLASQSQWQS